MGSICLHSTQPTAKNSTNTNCSCLGIIVGVTETTVSGFAPKTVQDVNTTSKNIKIDKNRLFIMTYGFMIIYKAKL